MTAPIGLPDLSPDVSPGVALRTATAELSALAAAPVSSAPSVQTVQTTAPPAAPAAPGGQWEFTPRGSRVLVRRDFRLEIPPEAQCELIRDRAQFEACVSDAIVRLQGPQPVPGLNQASSSGATPPSGEAPPAA